MINIVRADALYATKKPKALMRLLLTKIKIKMEFDRIKQIIVLFMFLPVFGYCQQHPYDPLEYKKEEHKGTRTYTLDLACENQKDTIVVQVLTDPFDDFFLDVATELDELTYYMDSREKKYCPIYYDEIGKKDGKLILNVAFGSSEW
jgi:hypothetical protein